MNNKYLYALDLLPLGLKNAIEKLSITDLMRICEIRLRVGSFLTVKTKTDEFFVTYGGNLSLSTANAIKIYKNDIEYTYLRSLIIRYTASKRSLKTDLLPQKAVIESDFLLRLYMKTVKYQESAM